MKQLSRRRSAAPERSVVLLPKDIEDIWREVAPRLQISPSYHMGIATAANYWNTNVILLLKQEQQQKEFAAAHKILSELCEIKLAECHSTLCEFACPETLKAHVNNLNMGELESLSVGLRATKKLIIKPENWQMSWVLPAVQIWQEAALALAAAGKKAGVSERSVAVKFTYRVLLRLGYREARPCGPHDACGQELGMTPGAVAKAIKRKLPPRPKKGDISHRRIVPLPK